MSKPLIGIICGPHYENGALYYGLLPGYLRSIAAAGGLPVMIAPNHDEETLRAMFDRMDAVLMAGGADVDPKYYGMDGHPTIYGVDPLRDTAELAVIRWAAKEDKPLLGICRGVQMMNVALGGTLYRDIPSEYPDFTGVNHSNRGKGAWHLIAHKVDVLHNSRLAEAMGLSGGLVEVNSLHHQAVREVAPSLKISAVSEDGIVEGIELPDARFFVGVQWHPEEITGSQLSSREAMEHLFATFVRAAQRKE